MKASDPFREYINIVISKCPHEYRQITYGEGEYDPYSYSKIVTLHEDLVARTHNLKRAQM